MTGKIDEKITDIVENIAERMAERGVRNFRFEVSVTPRMYCIKVRHFPNTASGGESASELIVERYAARRVALQCVLDPIAVEAEAIMSLLEDYKG